MVRPTGSALGLPGDSEMTRLFRFHDDRRDRFGAGKFIHRKIRADPATGRNPEPTGSFYLRAYERS